MDWFPLLQINGMFIADITKHCVLKHGKQSIFNKMRMTREGKLVQKGTCS